MSARVVLLLVLGMISFLAGLSLTMVTTAVFRETATRTAERSPAVPARSFEQTRDLIDRARLRGAECLPPNSSPLSLASDSLRSRWEIEREEFQQFFEKWLKYRGETRFFRKAFGPFPARALGVSRDESDAWRLARTPCDDFMEESSTSALKRLSVINLASPVPLVPASFQLIAYTVGDSMEAIVGQDLGTARLGREIHLASLLSRSRHKQEHVPSALRERLLEAIDRYEENRFQLRFSFWEAVGPVVRKKIEAGMYEYDVIGLHVARGRLHVFRHGQCYAVDRAIGELTRARDDLYRAVRSLLR